MQAGGHVTVWIDGQRTVTFTPTFEPTQNGLIHLTAGAHRIRVEVTPTCTSPSPWRLSPVTAGLHLGWQPQENQLVAQAAAAARAADVAVVVASAPASEGWDRSTLALPADQDTLIAAVAAANPRTIVVLNTSSAVTMPWLAQVAGVVEVWFPGQTAGTAIAQVLFGDVNPSGKLPVTFPASDHQGPARTRAEYPGDGTDVYYSEGTLVGYRWYDAQASAAAVPLRLTACPTRRSGSPGSTCTRTGGTAGTVDRRVTNTGSRAGAEVAQLYVGAPRRSQRAARGSSRRTARSTSLRAKPRRSSWGSLGTPSRPGTTPTPDGPSQRAATSSTSVTPSKEPPAPGRDLQLTDLRRHGVVGSRQRPCAGFENSPGNPLGAVDW